MQGLLTTKLEKAIFESFANCIKPDFYPRRVKIIANQIDLLRWTDCFKSIQLITKMLKITENDTWMEK